MNGRISEPGIPILKARQVSGSGKWRATLVGLVPLVLLAIIVGILLLLIAFIRPLVASDSFFMQEQIILSIVGMGLTVAAIAYTIGIMCALRHIGISHRSGDTASATRGLLVLSITAVVVALPVLVPLFMH